MIETNKNKTIAIIGGGPAGLVTCKTALECEFTPIVFEKSNNFGGTWAPDSTKAWNSMKTNISKYSCSFSDFPHENSNDVFLSQPQVYSYLNSYAKKFDLYQYIKTSCSVTKVSRVDENDTTKWKVEWVESNGISKVEHQKVYDFVIIATGINNKPAKFDQAELFSAFNGRVNHSINYKSPESYKDKRVLVVGNAFSGTQIACEVSSVAKSVHQLIRRTNQWILTTELTLDIDKDNEINAPLDFFFYKRNQSYDNFKNPGQAYNQFLNTTVKALTKDNYGSAELKYDESLYSVPPFFVITNKEYVPLVESGNIKLLKNYSISEVNGNQLTFKSNKDQNEIKQLEFDEIILSNGYYTDLSYLEQEILDEINYIASDYYVSCLLHKNVFPSKFKNIAFVGIINTPFFTTLELMSRWSCYTFANIVDYPSQETIQKGIKYQYQLRNNQVNERYQFPYVDPLIHFDDLAKEFGACPDFENIKTTDPELYEKIWTSLFCNASYRLTGPFSISNAKQIINDYDSTYKKFMAPKKK